MDTYEQDIEFDRSPREISSYIACGPLYLNYLKFNS